MRASGVGGDCADYKCGHRIVVNADQWFDETQLSDLEDRFVCMVCGQRGPDVGPDFGWDYGREKFSANHACFL